MHNEQLTPPYPLAYFPLSHNRHDSTGPTTEDEYVPALQGKQADMPKLIENLPTGQSKHVLDAFEEKLP